MALEWESALHDDEPRDQNADTGLLAHGYWSLGPEADETWSVVLIEQDATLAEIFHWRWDFEGEQEAKAYAEQVEAYGRVPGRG